MNFRPFRTASSAITISLVAMSFYVNLTTQTAAAQTPAATLPAARAEAPASGPTSAPAAAPAISAPPITWGIPKYKPIQKVNIGSLDPASGYTFQIELINDGAAIYTLKLADYYSNVADTRLAHKLKNNAEYEKAVAADPAKYHGHYSLLNPLPRGQVTAAQAEALIKEGKSVSIGQDFYLPLATREITVKTVAGQGTTLNLDAPIWEPLPAPATATADSQSVSFVCTLARQEGANAWKPYLKLIKTYTVRKNDYSIHVSLKLENLSGEPLTVGIGQNGPAGLPREEVRQDERKLVYGRLNPEGNNVTVKLLDIKNKDLDASANLGWSDSRDPILWEGDSNKFFASMLYVPPIKDTQQIVGSRYKVEFFANKVSENSTSTVYLPGIKMPELQLPVGGSTTVDFNLFAGPKSRAVLEGNALYKQLNYISTVDVSGGCFCSFSWLAQAIMTFLEFLAEHVTRGNYGIAIILLVIIVRLLLHPLTKKGQVSMMKMQKLGPKMAELKEKYKDDKDTLQRETMKFYKEQGATPILGCLPMLLQMPIWIALYAGLNAEVELRHAAFLPFWITNLAGQDAIWSWASHPIEIPLLYGLMGPIVSFNLLPILLTIAMYYQTKLNPASMGAAATPQQQQQQKMMKYMTPVMMLLFFYNAPAGLTLYIMASTFSSVVEQMIIRKHIQEKEALEAATETTISMPGKKSRTSRTKKPKGPGWMKHQ